MTTSTKFEYSRLPVDLAAEARQTAERIRGLVCKQLELILQVGSDLLVMKQKLRGQFVQWVDAECVMSLRSAERYMQVAAHFRGTVVTVSTLAPATLYRLAAPSTPEAVRAQVLDSLEAGHPISDREVLTLVANARKQKEEPSPAGGPEPGTAGGETATGETQPGIKGGEAATGENEPASAGAGVLTNGAEPAIDAGRAAPTGLTPAGRVLEAATTGAADAQTENAEASARSVNTCAELDSGDLQNEKQSSADDPAEPGAAASAEGKMVSERLPPQLATPAGLQVYPNVDPYNDAGPLWVRGALQLIGVLGEEALTLACIRNCQQITGLLLQLIDVLAPTFLDNPISAKKREQVVGLLRDRCGYKDLVDQLEEAWTKADKATIETQLEMFSGD